LLHSQLSCQATSFLADDLRLEERPSLIGNCKKLGPKMITSNHQELFVSLTSDREQGHIQASLDLPPAPNSVFTVVFTVSRHVHYQEQVWSGDHVDIGDTAKYH
jgi:hypothetical protein